MPTIDMSDCPCCEENLCPKCGGALYSDANGVVHVTGGTGECACYNGDHTLVRLVAGEQIWESGQSICIELGGAAFVLQCDPGFGDWWLTVRNYGTGSEDYFFFPDFESCGPPLVVQFLNVTIPGCAGTVDVEFEIPAV